MAIDSGISFWPPSGWCCKLWDITSLGHVQLVGFFDVAARLRTGDGPIAALLDAAVSGLKVQEWTKQRAKIL